uniref:Uncharacterized protein n=1 Tax=Lepeophtheirus salmonis TaxID=72036 RepID=A0A0K2T1U0_LEPSM
MDKITVIFSSCNVILFAFRYSLSNLALM